MIGDNRHQGEIVSPEDKLQEMALKAAALAAGGANDAELLAVLKQILAFFAEYADCCVGSGITKKIFYPKNQPEHKSNRKTRTACVRRHYGKEILCQEHGAPSPVSISVNDQIIWSANTGRSASGSMIGDVVAEKKDIAIKWGILTETELAAIKKIMVAGFFPISFHDDGIDLTITTYRGNLTKEVLGYIGDGIFYYKSASVSIIQK